MRMPRTIRIACTLAVTAVGCAGSDLEPNTEAPPTQAAAAPSPTATERPPGRAMEDRAPQASGGAVYHYVRVQPAETNYTALGVAALLSQNQPVVEAPYPGQILTNHSIGQIAVLSVDASLTVIHTVEAGWRVTSNDPQPRFFVSHQVNGVHAAYDQGLVLYGSRTISPGDHIPNVGTDVTYRIEANSAGDWWVAWNGQWVGYFPRSEWGATAWSGNRVMWYGEVASDHSVPCTDMGNGISPINPFGAAFLAAKMYALRYVKPGLIYPSHVDVVPTLPAMPNMTDPTWYTGTLTNQTSAADNRFRFGGSGGC